MPINTRIYGHRAAALPTLTIAWGATRGPTARAVELRGAALRGGPVRASTDAQGREEARQERAGGPSALRGGWTVRATVGRGLDADAVAVTATRRMGRLAVRVMAAGPVARAGLADADAPRWTYRYEVERAPEARRGVGPLTEAGTGATWGEAVARALARARAVEGQGCELAGLARVGAAPGAVAEAISDAQAHRTADAEERAADAAEMQTARRRGPRGGQKAAARQPGLF
jgi:hypothetical protein